jgi:hypothetical protein
VSKSDALPFDKKRVIVLHEADWRCTYCKGEADEVDHIWPRKWGGGDDFGNLQAICRTCNASKGSTIYLSDITPARCDLRVPLEVDGAAGWVRSAARWLSVKADIIDGEDPSTAYRNYRPLHADNRPARPEEVRRVLSDLWVRLLHETPGQAALAALADLGEWRVISGDEEHDHFELPEEPEADEAVRFAMNHIFGGAGIHFGPAGAA